MITFLLFVSVPVPAMAAPEIDAPSYILMEASTGKVICEQNADERRSPASITKIMTLLLIFDYLNTGRVTLQSEVTTSAYAKSMGGSQVFLEEGEVQTLETMIKCIAVASGNDASVAVAEFLESCPATRFVWYPGLKSHPQHDRAEKLMHGEYSGMISFDLKGDEKQHEKFLDALKLVTHAVSLGDIETLIVYYDRNSDKLPHYPAVYQEGFFRFSIGLEDAEDIIADLTQAMQAAGML